MADPHDFEELVLEHVDAENAKNLLAMRQTWSALPRVVDVPSGAVFEGASEVESFYQTRWTGFPNASRKVTRLMSTEDGCYVEIEVKGKHEGPLDGLAATGRETQVKLCQFFAPDADGRIAEVTLYYDALTILTQLGVIPDIGSTLGKAWLGVSSPKLMFKAVAERLKGQ